MLQKQMVEQQQSQNEGLPFIGISEVDLAGSVFLRIDKQFIGPAISCFRSRGGSMKFGTNFHRLAHQLQAAGDILFEDVDPRNTQLVDDGVLITDSHLSNQG